jgi:hypothetical protein
MAGFENDVVFSKNADFSQLDNQAPIEANGLVTDGKMWIGATAVNAGGTHINVGSLISPNSSITVGFSSPNITLTAAASIPTTFTADSGSATPAASNLNILGSTAAAGTSPLVTTGAGSTITVVAQRSQALAAADSTKVGLSNFDSTSFAVAATGFVTLSTTGAGKTITGDSGGALSPTANNWNILGGPGVTTTGSGSTLTINSVVFTDTTATTMAVDNGYNATAAGTYNLPASAAQGELIHIFCDTAGAVVVDAPALNFIRIGSAITSSGGTATSTVQGDSLTLRYRLSSLTWESTAVEGNWITA